MSATKGETTTTTGFITSHLLNDRQSQLISYTFPESCRPTKDAKNIFPIDKCLDCSSLFVY